MSDDERTPHLRDRLRYIDAVLEDVQGRPDIAPRGDPLSVLIETILSQSTSGANSRRAFATLTERFPTWEDALDARPDAIEEAIRAGGLAAQKSRRIHAILREIRDERGAVELADLCDWSDEAIYERLGAFTGVGTKTIAIVLMFACGRDVMPVDTHVHRIARRLALVPTSASADRTFELLAPHVPPGRGPTLHVNLIRFGRSRCTARNPGCETCPLYDICAFDTSSGEIHDPNTLKT